MSFFGTYSSLSVRGFGGMSNTDIIPNYTRSGNIVSGTGFSISINDSGNTVGYSNPMTSQPNLAASFATVQNRTTGNINFLVANSNVNNYGWSIAIDGIGNTIVVGAEAAVQPYANSGPYIWNRTGANTWSILQKLSMPSGGNIIGNIGLFGLFTAIDKTGNYVAIWGARGNAPAYGTVFIYNKVGNTFSLQQQIVPPVQVAENTLSFGQQLDFANAGNILVIGESAYSNNRGAIHVYNRTGNIWNLTNTITPNNSSANQYFSLGTLNSNDANYIIGVDANQNDNTASLYVFRKNESNNYIQLQQIPVAPGLVSGSIRLAMDGTGRYFSMADQYTTVGSNANAGKVITYYYGNENYIQNQQIVGNIANQRLGLALDLNENANTMVISQFNPGGAFVYLANA